MKMRETVLMGASSQWPVRNDHAKKKTRSRTKDKQPREKKEKRSDAYSGWSKSARSVARGLASTRLRMREIRIVTYLRRLL